MTNREKYANEIRIALSQGEFDEFYNKHIYPTYKSGDFYSLRDFERTTYVALWLDEEYTEPEVDWSKVAVDTPILVRDSIYGDWQKRYFARFEDGKVYAWDRGQTGWLCDYNRLYTTDWEYAKLTNENS